MLTLMCFFSAAASNIKERNESAFLREEKRERESFSKHTKQRDFSFKKRFNYDEKTSIISRIN